MAVSLARFIAHLVNQQVAHEILGLQLLHLLLENPTDESVEVSIGFTKECGQFLTEVRTGDERKRRGEDGEGEEGETERRRWETREEMREASVTRSGDEENETHICCSVARVWCALYVKNPPYIFSYF